MNALIIQVYKKHIKESIGFAKELVASPNPIMYELGHYLADKGLLKICMVLLVENNRNDLVYRNGRDGFTFDLKTLYDNLKTNFFPRLPDYDTTIKVFHDQRNMYQHSIEELKETMQRVFTEEYVKIVIELMKNTQIIGINEDIPETSILTDAHTNRFPIIQAQERLQELYNEFKNKDSKNIIYSLRNKITSNIDLITEYLDMVYEPLIHRDPYFHNSDWKIVLTSEPIGVSLYNMASGGQLKFHYGRPNEHTNVFDSFLHYFIDQLSNKSITLNS